jgi:hypothetical protein
MINTGKNFTWRVSSMRDKRGTRISMRCTGRVREATKPMSISGRCTSPRNTRRTLGTFTLVKSQGPIGVQQSPVGRPIRPRIGATVNIPSHNIGNRFNPNRPGPPRGPHW